MRTFGKLRNHLEQIGISAFERLYDENKEAFDVFARNNVLPSCPEAIAQSHAARQHCLRVMCAVELCASKLDKQQSIVDYVRALAGRHCGFGIKAEHFLVSIRIFRIFNFFCKFYSGAIWMPSGRSF